MTWKIALPLAVGALLTVASPVAAKSPLEGNRAGARQCFWAQQVNGFASSDDRIVNVRVGARDVYQLEMFGRCPDVDWNERIALVSRGSSHICTGLQAEIISQTTIGPQRCPVRSMRKLTPDEVEALPGRARP
jgi:hypothetical protein